MENFKRIDFYLNVLLITGFGTVSLIKQDVTFIYGYFVVGVWQVTSMFVHAANGWFLPKGGKRSIYHWTVLGILAVAALGFAIPSLFLIFYIMLFAAPFMAIIYTAMCYTELNEIKKRHALALR